MEYALIGRGAIGHYVETQLARHGHNLRAVIVRPERMETQPQTPALITQPEQLPDGLGAVVDCAGHAALAQFGPGILRAGHRLVTVSLGALADAELHDRLTAAASDGGGTLILASGAIGGLDTLRAARAGGLSRVRYVGRKPPKGWIGSPAEDTLDLNAPLNGAQTHFTGSARAAALAYPKNANVAAAVALAGLGFDDTQVELIADPDVHENIHQIEAEGMFGRFSFEIRGKPLPDNPRSSALAAMSAVAAVLELQAPIRF